MDWKYKAQELLARITGPRKSEIGSSHIFKSKGYYKIVTQSETVAGFLLSGDPVCLIPIDDVEALKNAVFDSLKSSRKNVTTPRRDDYPELHKMELKKLKERSYKSLYLGSSSCALRLENGVLKIYPETFYNPVKPSRGLVQVESDMVEIPDAENRKDEVASVIIEMLNRKYR